MTLAPPAFCSPFDEALAHRGPPAVFLTDREGRLRFDAQWTRDAYGRHPGPHEAGWVWIVATDRASGFALLVLSTAVDLLQGHPRLDLVPFREVDRAREALAALGHPPIDRSRS